MSCRFSSDLFSPRSLWSSHGNTSGSSPRAFTHTVPSSRMLTPPVWAWLPHPHPSGLGLSVHFLRQAFCAAFFFSLSPILSFPVFNSWHFSQFAVTYSTVDLHSFNKYSLATYHVLCDSWERDPHDVCPPLSLIRSMRGRATPVSANPFIPQLILVPGI